MIPTAPSGRPRLPSRASLYVPANALILGWFVAAAVISIAHRFVPAAGWLMVHLLLLGGVSTAIILWSQHFAETLLRRPAPGGRRGLWVRLLGWSAGAAVVTAGMVTERTPLVVAGAVVLAAIAVLHLVVLVRQAGGSTRMLSNRLSHLVRYYLLATAMLPIGVGIGVVLARVEVGPEVAGRLYVAHVVATLLGWVGTTVAGTVVLLWPTVLRTKISPAAEANGKRALLVLVAGLAIALAGPASGLRPLVALGALVVAASIVLLGIHVVAQGRAASAAGTGGTFAAASIGLSLVWLLGCAIAFGAVAASAPSWTVVPDRLTGLVAPFAAGFVAQVMVGSMTYLLPVVLGGGPPAVRWSIAAMERGGAARLVILNACVLLFALPLPSWVAVTVSMLGLGSLLAFLVISVRVIVLQRRTAKRTLDLPDHRSGPVPPVAFGASLTGRRGLTGAGIGAAMVAGVVLLGIAADPVSAGVTAIPAISGGQSGDSAAVQGTGETTTITVTMSGMRFSPDVLEVPAGNTLVVDLVNADDQIHDLVLDNGTTSGRLGPGESAQVDVGLVTSGMDGWCSVAGHRLMGMTLTVVALGGTTADEHDTTHDHGDHGTTTGPSAVDDLDLMGEPGEDIEAREAALPPAATSGTDANGMTSEPDPDGEGTLHRVTFTVEEIETEVAPGVVQTLWTFNGVAPGPALRGQVGDTFEITLVNDGTLGHSIDFHAGALAPDEPMRTINPGERLTYVFRAERSGIWMYHCSTMPMSLHIANGMFGAVVIDPPDLDPVDREYLLVQSEMYLGPQGGTADEERLATQHPDLVVFNGYANQYVYEPLPVLTGERVRIWVLDVGPNRPSSFHVVGGQFDTVFFEGDYQLRHGGESGTGGSQALALQPAQGGFVELTFPEAGHYSGVTHIMSDAEKGGSAVFEVTDP